MSTIGHKLAAAEISRNRYDKVKKVAENESRSVSGLIRRLLQQEVEKAGEVW